MRVTKLFFGEIKLFSKLLTFHQCHRKLAWKRKINHEKIEKVTSIIVHSNFLSPFNNPSLDNMKLLNVTQLFECSEISVRRHM